MTLHSQIARSTIVPLAQRVHVCRSVYSGSPVMARYVVLVTPEGETHGRYYDCGDRSLALLRSGMSPVDLDLEELETDEAGEDE